MHDKRLVSEKILQNPNDPDAQYRGKGGKKIEGYSTNITETTDEEDKPSLITDVCVKGGGTADNSFLKDALINTEVITGNKVKAVHADGTYQSQDNRKLPADEQRVFDFIANGIQGKPSRFELNLINDMALKITDQQVIIAIPTKGDKWKIQLQKDDDTTVWRYFDRNYIEKAKTRREVDSIPFEERKKRKNGMSLTPLNCALKALILALNDSANAFVSSKKTTLLTPD